MAHSRVGCDCTLIICMQVQGKHSTRRSLLGSFDVVDLDERGLSFFVFFPLALCDARIQGSRYRGAVQTFYLQCHSCTQQGHLAGVAPHRRLLLLREERRLFSITNRPSPRLAAALPLQFPVTQPHAAVRPTCIFANYVRMTQEILVSGNSRRYGVGLDARKQRAELGAEFGNVGQVNMRATSVSLSPDDSLIKAADTWVTPTSPFSPVTCRGLMLPSLPPPISLHAEIAGRSTQAGTPTKTPSSRSFSRTPSPTTSRFVFSFYFVLSSSGFLLSFV